LKKTLVIGASPEPSRYSFMAINALKRSGHEVIAFGKQKGHVAGVEIEQRWNDLWDPHTITLYINPLVQGSFYEKILTLNPKRVIFNPGTENRKFQDMLDSKGIEWEEACTLVLLSMGQY
jgi:uncharacterized protein